MDSVYYIVYKTINNVNGKFYVGSHQTKKIEDGYLGSGTHLKKAIRKYGRGNFKRDIIAFCKNAEVMRCVETHLVRYSIEKYGQKKCYNRSYSGTGAMLGENNSFYGKEHSEESRKIMSDKVKERFKNGEDNPFFGRKHTYETKEKLRNNGKILLASPAFWKYHWYRNRYWYCTPYGCFISDREAAKHCPWSRSTIKDRCNNPNKIVRPNYQVEKEFYWKTWEENGFYKIDRNM